MPYARAWLLYDGAMSETLKGKTMVVTGGTAGIGRETVLRLVAQGADVLFVGRNRGKADAVLAEAARLGGGTASFLQGDLSSLDDVRRVAAEIRARLTRLDVLVNNAGAIFTQRHLSVDGIEMTFALNHLNYFLLTRELLPLLQASAPARIVNVASAAHVGARVDFDDLQGARRYRTWKAYGQSKLCNILFTYELARRLQGSGITANCLHPGFVASEFGDNNSFYSRLAIQIAKTVGAIGVGNGAKTSVYLATSPEVEGRTGGYYAKSRPAKSTARSHDQLAAHRLWTVSETMVAPESSRQFASVT